MVKSLPVMQQQASVTNQHSAADEILSTVTERISRALSLHLPMPWILHNGEYREDTEN